MRNYFLLLFFVSFFTSQSFAVSYIWSPTGGSTSANTAGNWKKGPGACGNAVSTVVPGSGDTITFTSTCSNANCHIDANFTVKLINVKSNYTDTIFMDAGKTLTFETASLLGGVFKGNNGTVTCTKSITLNGTKFIAPTGIFSVAGNFSCISGGFVHNSGSVIFSHGTTAGTRILSSTSNSVTIVFNAVEFAAADSNSQVDVKNITMEIDGQLLISGSRHLFINTSTSSVINAKGDIESINSNSVGGGTVSLIVNGTGSQTINDNNGSTASGKLPNIKINKSSGTCSLLGDIGLGGSCMWEYASGNVSVGSSKLYCYYNNTLKNSSSGTMSFYDLEMYGQGGTHTIDGTVKVTHSFITSQTSACVISAAGGGGTLELQGDVSWNCTNTSSFGTAVFKFSGSASQTFSGSITPEIYTLQMAKAGGSVTLATPVTIANNLNLTAKNIITDATNILTVNNGATVSNGSGSSFISGPLKKIGNSAFTFPVGKSSSYKPINISAPSSASDAFTAEYFGSQQSFGSSKDSLTYISTCEYWNLARTTGSSNVQVKLYWDNTTCDIYTLSTLKIARWDGSKWSNTGMTTTTGTPTAGTVQTNSTLSAFGNFAIGKRSPVVFAHAGDDIDLCIGSTHSIGAISTATGGVTPYSYSWSPNTAISSTTAANPNITPSSTISYIISVTDLDHNTSRDTIVVHIHSKPTAHAGNDTAICGHSLITLGDNPTATGGTSPYTYEWSPITYIALDSFRNANPTSKPDSIISYHVTVTDNYGCTAKDTINILVHPQVFANAGVDTMTFLGQNVTLGAPNVGYKGTPPYTYAWKPNIEIDDTTHQHPIVSPPGTQQYQVKVTDSFGCTYYSPVLVTVLPPFATLSHDYSLLSGDSIIIKDSVYSYGKVGATDYISLTVSASDSILVGTSSVTDALVNLDTTLAILHRLTGTSISGELSGITLSPGIYKISGSAHLDDTLTLSGNSNSYFVIDITDSFICDNGATIILNGIPFQNVVFRIGDYFKGSGTITLEGIFLAKNSVQGEQIMGDASIECLLGPIIVKYFPIIHAPSITPTLKLETSRDLPEDLFGYNGNTLSNEGSVSSDLQNIYFQDSLTITFPSVIRFPAGGEAKDWNWNDGWWVNLLESNNSSALSYPNSCTFNPYNRRMVNLSRFLDLQKNLRGSASSALMVLNFYAPEPFEKDKIQHAMNIDLPLKYIELGNEFYLGNGSCLFQNAWDYAAEANTWLDYIHSTYSGLIKVGVVGSAYTAADKETNCKNSTWNSAMGFSDVGNGSLLGNMEAGDALTFHVYPFAFDSEPSIPTGIYPNDLNNLFAQPFKVMDDLMGNEFKTVPSSGNTRIWITEFNLDEDKYYIHGSWAHGLWVAGLAMDFLRDSRVDKIICHTLVNDAYKGILFLPNIRGLQYSKNEGDAKYYSVDPVGNVVTENYSLTAAGCALKLVGEAMKNATSATELDFPGAPMLDETHQAIYGWQFEKANDKQVIIINFSDQPQYINRDNLFTGPYEQYAIPQYNNDPLNPDRYYIKGQSLQDNNNAIYLTDSDPFVALPAFEPMMDMNVNLIHTISSIKFSQIELLPFSITRLYQRSDLEFHITGIYDACEVSIINLFASGAPRYEWSVTENASVNLKFISQVKGSNITFGDLNGSVLNNANTYDITLKGLTSSGSYIPGDVITQTINVVQKPAPSISPSEVDNYCPVYDAPVTLTGSGGSGLAAVDYIDWYPTWPIVNSSVLANSIQVNPARYNLYPISEGINNIYLLGTNNDSKCSSVISLAFSSNTPLILKATGPLPTINDKEGHNLLEIDYCYGDCNQSEIVSVQNPSGTYTWFPPDGIDIDNSTNKITLLPNIITPIIYGVKDECGTEQYVFVNVLNYPYIDNYNADFCEGEGELSVLWTNGDCPAHDVSYQWQKEDNNTYTDIFGSTGATLDLSGYLAAAYNFRVIISLNDCNYSNTLDAKVSITDPPTVSNITITSANYTDFEMVSGCTLNLHTAVSSYNNNVTWTGTDFLNKVSNATDVEFTPDVSTCATITLTAKATNGSDCCIHKDCDISVYPIPHISIDPYVGCCPTEPFHVYLDNYTGCTGLPLGYEYFWNVNNTDVLQISSSADFDYYFTTENVTVKINVVSPDNCLKTSNYYYVSTILNTCCERLAQSPAECRLLLNPNPTSDVSQIQFNCDETVTGPLSLRIISYTGQTVGSFDFPDIDALSNFNLNLSSLSAGIYLAKVIAEKYSAEESFVVTK